MDLNQTAVSGSLVDTTRTFHMSRTIFHAFDVENEYVSCQFLGCDISHDVVIGIYDSVPESCLKICHIMNIF